MSNRYEPTLIISSTRRMMARGCPLRGQPLFLHHIMQAACPKTKTAGNAETPACCIVIEKITVENLYFKPTISLIFIGNSILLLAWLNLSAPTPTANTGTKSPQWLVVVQPIPLQWSSVSNTASTNSL